MARVLLGWGFGSGFGHVAKLLAIAVELKRLGHTPVLSIVDRKATAPLWQDKGIEVIGAPSVVVPPTPGAAPPARQETLADILKASRIYDAPPLVALGKAWANVVDQTKPDLVICDYAPNLAMLTLGRIPTISIGTGFATPPAGRPLPSLRFWEKVEPSEESRRNEAQVVANINAASEKLGANRVEHVSDLFGGEEVLVCCLPELDCYGAHRSTPAIGPLEEVGLPTAPQRRDALFAYLANIPDTSMWLEGIAQSEVEAEVYVRGLNVAEHAGKLPASVTLRDTPADLASTLPGLGLLIHHGGMSTADKAMRLGVPQLAVPMHMEQRINAASLATARLAHLAGRQEATAPQQFAERIRSMVADEALRTRATDAAQAIALRNSRPALEVAVEACLRHL